MTFTSLQSILIPYAIVAINMDATRISSRLSSSIVLWTILTILFLGSRVSSMYMSFPIQHGKTRTVMLQSWNFDSIQWCDLIVPSVLINPAPFSGIFWGRQPWQHMQYFAFLDFFKKGFFISSGCIIWSLVDVVTVAPFLLLSKFHLFFFYSSSLLADIDLPLKFRWVSTLTSVSLPLWPNPFPSHNYLFEKLNNINLSAD